MLLAQTAWFESAARYIFDQVAWPVGVLVGATTYWRWWRPRTLRRSIWAWEQGRKDKPAAILVDAVQSIVAGTYVRPSVGMGAATSLGIVTSALNGSLAPVLRPRNRTQAVPVLVVGDSLAVAALNEGNAVILGGPITNQVTREIVDILEAKSDLGLHCRYLSEDNLHQHGAARTTSKPFSFSVVDRTIELCGTSYTGTVRSPSFTDTINMSDYSGDDVGVIIRMFSPHATTRQNNRRVVCFFGSKTFGVHGAARWLLEPNNKGREVARLLRSEQNVVCVVQLKVRNGQVVRCRFAALASIP